MSDLKRIATILIIAMMIFSLSVNVPFIASQSQITLGTPIVILDDNYELNIIFKGNGTSENPFIIENLTIDVYAQPAILISNSQKHVIFRNITITIQKYESAVKVLNSENIVFENVTIIGTSTTDYGFLLNNVTNVKLKDIKIKDTLLPIKFEKTQDMCNEFINVTFDDVEVYIGHDIKNTIISGNYSNIYIYNATKVTLDNVSVGTQFDVYLITGVFAENVDNLIIKNSVIKGTNAINLKNAKNLEIYESEIIFAAYGVVIENSTNIFIDNVEFKGDRGDIAVSLTDFSNAKVTRVQSDGLYYAFSRGENLKIHKATIIQGGIDLSNVFNATLENVELTDNSRTVLGIRYSSGITIKESKVFNVKFVYGELEKEKPVNAIEIASSNYITFEKTLIQKVYTALYVLFSSNITLEETTIYDSAYALQSYYSDDILFIDSLIEKAGVAGIVSKTSSNILIKNTIIKNSKVAIYTLSTTSLKVTYSDFIGNDEDVVEDSPHEYFYNYWDKYKGKDENGDKIGDTAYKVSSFSEDPSPRIYPLRNGENLPEPIIEKDYTDIITLVVVIIIIGVIIVANVVYWVKSRRGGL